MARGRRGEEGRRADSMKGLGVTFYKQGIEGALSRKNPNAKTVVTPKPRPAATKSMSSGKPGESAMSMAEVSRPTVKAVRDESRMAKAEATRSLTSSRQGGMDTGNVMKKSYPSRQGGMDTGNVVKARPPAPKATVNPSDKTNPLYNNQDQNSSQTEAYRKRSNPTPAKKSIVGSIINRVTQPPKKLNAASEKILADARAEITPVVTALAGGRLLYKGGKKVVDIAVKAYKGPTKYTSPRLGRNTKPQKVDADNVGRPIEELFKKGKGTPKPQATKPQKYSTTDPNFPLPPSYRPPARVVPKKVKFPKAVKGRKITGTGTYTQFD
jgi:hypothetical protein